MAKKEKKPRKKKKPGLGSRKGGEFEREICRVLTTWIDPSREQGKPELFWRSATSGAKATQDRKSGRKANQDGDLISIADDELGTSHFWFTKYFNIECKDRYDYGNLDLALEEKGDFWKWWTKTVSDSERSNKMPLLIFKRYRKEILIAHWTDAHRISVHLPAFQIWAGFNRHAISICHFDGWLEANKPSVMKQLLTPPKHLGKAKP